MDRDPRPAWVISSKSTDPRRGPGAELDPADESALLQGTPVVAIVAVIPIVAQDEILPGLQSHRGHRITDRAGDVGLIHRFTIDEHPATGDLHRLAGQSDDPLDAGSPFLHDEPPRPDD